LFLAVDANFHLKLKSCGIADPEIGARWSYFVEPKRYNEHISQKTVEVEVGLLSRAGQTSISPCCPLERWAQVLVIWPLMIAGVGGIGRRFLAWVFSALPAIFGSMADLFRRRTAPSKSVEGPPHEDETHIREQEV